MTASPLSMPYSTDAQCPLCLTNPFEEDLTMSSHNWNGHSVTSGSGTQLKKKIIHGICARCLPSVPRNEQFLQCFECRMPFPGGRRSEIIVRRDGSLIRETLLPPIENRDVLQNLGAAFPTGSCGFLAIGATSSIAYIAAALVASSTSTTVLVQGVNFAVRVTVWTPTVMVATYAQPVLLSVALGAMALGVISALGELGGALREGE